MASNSSRSDLDWKIWFIGFAVVAVGGAMWLNKDVKVAQKTELATDQVNESMQSHTNKNRQASEVLSSVAKRK